MATRRNSHYRPFPSLIACVVLLLHYSSAQFDHFKLVLTWPHSFCLVYPGKCHRTPLPLNFTIHGLWPDKQKGKTSPCKKYPVSPLNDKNLELRLEESWPDLRRDSKLGFSTIFWKEQWDKHGSCAWPLYNYEKYFLKALEFKDKFDVLGHLVQDSLGPGTSPTVSRNLVNKTISQATTGIPILKCPSNYLTEVVICFKPTGVVVVACPQPPKDPCPNENVNFP
uniref:S3-RNase n=1 Tax=Antirrhinum hispanicum TaxID=49039 RepID=Q93X98_ANTHI|nr:S3-RNase [Antirrhinum hispanicum]